VNVAFNVREVFFDEQRVDDLVIVQKFCLLMQKFSVRELLFSRIRRKLTEKDFFLRGLSELSRVGGR